MPSQTESDDWTRIQKEHSKSHIKNFSVFEGFIGIFDHDHQRFRRILQKNATGKPKKNRTWKDSLNKFLEAILNFLLLLDEKEKFPTLETNDSAHSGWIRFIDQTAFYSYIFYIALPILFDYQICVAFVSMSEIVERKAGGVSHREMFAGLVLFSRDF